MKFKKMIFLLLLLLVPLCFFACKTTGQFNGSSTLTILLVDENGSCVKDCSVILSNFNKSECGITNSSGMCVFNNVPAGEYKLAGQKIGYAKLDSRAFDFNSKSDVFCFEILSSSYIFDKAEVLYEQQNYQKALELLDQIVCDKKSSLYAAICFYKAYGYARQENKKSTLSELKKMTKTNKDFSTLYDILISKITMQDENENDIEGENAL